MRRELRLTNRLPVHLAIALTNAIHHTTRITPSMANCTNTPMITLRKTAALEGDAM